MGKFLVLSVQLVINALQRLMHPYFALEVQMNNFPVRAKFNAPHVQLVTNARQPQVHLVKMVSMPLQEIKYVLSAPQVRNVQQKQLSQSIVVALVLNSTHWQDQFLAHNVLQGLAVQVFRQPLSLAILESTP